MRPRRMAAENRPRRSGKMLPDWASMRPRRMAAENVNPQGSRKDKLAELQ